MVSLKDIAAACGVSIATVSKALNNQSDISSARREEIRQKAAEMGYHPNLNARALKTKVTRDIGV
ncbi:MAG: LacI family DNA-binding transcriptional regulator, partial [Prevotella sp.]|nr:LacI family DNA-binding transcriptional regulator [Prevotella sp.]